jgi:ketol-acid reductoisomerase
LRELMMKVDTDVIGKGLELKDNAVSNRELVRVDSEIRNHPVEQIGTVLRAYMTAMKPVI